MEIINEQEKVGEEKNPVMPYEDAKALYEAQLSNNRQFFVNAARRDDTVGDVFLATTQKFAQKIEKAPKNLRIYWGQNNISHAAVADWAVGAFTKGFLRTQGVSPEVSEGLSDITKDVISKESGISDLRSRGQQLIISANRELEEIKKRQQSESIKLRDSHPILEGLFSTGEEYGAAMMMAIVPGIGPLLSAAYMSFMAASGTAEEGLEQYKAEHPEDKELKGFVADEKSVKEVTLNTLKTFVNGVEEYILGPAGQARYASKMAKLAERGFKPMRYGALRYAIKRGAIGAAQEFTEEGLLQGTSDTIFDYLLGRYKSGDEAVKAWKENLAQAGFAALYGGVFGVGGAIMDRAKGIEATRELLKDVVAEQDLDKVATVVFENELNNVMDVATVATEISSQLNTQKGEIYDAFRNAAFQAMKESGGYKGLTDESLWAHANEVSERLSQEAVAEAFKRKVPIQEVIDSNDIVYKDGELHLAKTDGESNLGKKIGEAYNKTKLYQYGGVNAANANQESLGNAISMIAQGKSNEEIRQATGWFMADDQKLRYEFSDRESKINKKEFDKITNIGDVRARKQELLDDIERFRKERDEKSAEYPEGYIDDLIEQRYNEIEKIDYAIQHGVYQDAKTTLGKLFMHDKLYEAYPFMKDIPVVVGDLGRANGAYDGEKITISERLTKPETWRGVLLHEIQHIIQEYEGFARGGSTKTRDAVYKKVRDEVSDETMAELIGKENVEKYRSELEEINDKYGDDFDEYYKRYTALNKKYGTTEDAIRDTFEKNMKIAEKENHLDLSSEMYYYNLMGEVEARDVQKRANLTEKQRQNWKNKPELSTASGKYIVTLQDGTVIKKSMDEGELFQSGEENRNLVVYHNISKESLEKAMKLGGLPVPSLAITRKDIPFGRFGEISLVGNKEIIDPSNYKNEVYNRDVWSATFPQTEYRKPKDSAIKKFKNKYGKFFEKAGDTSALSSFVYSLTFSPARAENEIANSLGMKLAYIETELGKDFEIPKKDFGESILKENRIDEQFVEDLKGVDINGESEDIKKAVTEAYRKMLDRKDYSEFGKYAERVKNMEKTSDNTFDENGIMYFGKADNLLYAAKKYEQGKDKSVLDDTALRQKIDDLIKDKQAYREWSRNTLEYELLGEPKIEVGRSLKEMTLQNIVDAMTLGETKNAQDSFVYGTGKVIAAGAKKLESIADIKLESGKFVSEEEEKAIHEKLTEDITSFSSRILKLANISFDFNAMSAAHAALGNIATLKNPTVDSLQKALNKEMGEKRVYPRYILEEGVRIAEEVKGLARHYFEAKPQRAVMLNEFSGAIVPTDTKYDDISQKLQEQGLKVVRSDNQLEAVKEFEDEFFQVQGLGKNAPVRRGSYDANSKVIKLFENANTSTLPHELAHYWLDNMWNYAKSGNANQQYVAQFNAVRNFLGVKPDQENLTRAQHEKFASAYEKYLYRGEFPTPIMGTVFANYERFIRDVYQSINDIRAQGKSKVRLTPEIIQFFDSMTSGELPTDLATTEMLNETRAEEVHQYDSKVVETVKKEVVPPESAPVVTPEATVKEILPVGSSGEVAESRLAKRTTESMGMESDLQYERANIEQERAKAAEMWKNDPQKAQAELNNATMGNEVLRNALYTEQQRIALENGDRDTFLKSLRKQSAEATRAGQELAALRGVVEDITMPSYWIRMAEWEAQKQLAKNMATYFDKVMGNTPLLNFTQKFDADVKALYEKVRKAETNAEKSKIMKEGLDEMKKTYRGLNQQEVGELFQTDWTNEELAYDYVEKKARDAVGLNLTNEKANAIIQASRDLDKLSRNVDEFGLPTAQFFAKKSELEYLINSHTPSSQTKVLLSTLGRANMLTAPATSVLNVASNVQNYGAQTLVRRLNNTITGHTNDNLVDSNLRKQYRKRVWDTFWATGYDLSMMNSIADTRLYRGESAVNSAGEGVIRQAGQWAEKHIFGELISSPDMVFKSYLAFTDFAGNEATDIAYKEGLTGDKAKARANELFTDAVKIEPKTEIGKQIRAKAQADALVITFQQDTKLARALLDLRNIVNKATGDVGVGDLLSAFVKTPANVLALGYDATVGPFGHLVNTFGAIQDARAGNLTSARVMATIRQTTTMAVMQAIVAAFALGFIDDDDYIPDYSQLSPSERLIVKERGASFGSIRIGDTYISTDFFGPFEVPLTAWLNARRQQGFADSASAYIGSVLRKGLDAPVIKDLLDQAKAAESVGSDSLSIWEHIYDTAGNLLISRLTPNVMNTLAKMTDDYERETNKSVLNKLIARVPVARKTLAPKMSVSTGKPVETPSALMQLLFGSRAHKLVDSTVSNELYRLYQSGERATISDITRSGDLKLIDEKEKQSAKEWFAREYSKAAERAIKTSTYRRKSDEDKKDELNKIRRDLVKQLKEKYKKKISVAKQKK